MKPVNPCVTDLPATMPRQDNLVCEICGGRMVERHCKIVCVNCGYTRDCSDP
jgi:hypothetical protein